MNRQTRKRTYLEAQDDCHRIQEEGPVVSHRGVCRRLRRGRARCRRRVGTVSLVGSISEERSMTVIGVDGNQVNVKGEGISSTETDG